MTGRLNSNSRIALGLLAAVILSSGIYFARQSGADPLVYSNDFNVFYHAASEVMAGRDPYQRSLTGWTPYLYPPLLSELMIPLALLPLTVAAYAWFLIGVVSVASAAWMSAALCDKGSSPQRRGERREGAEVKHRLSLRNLYALCVSAVNRLLIESKMVLIAAIAIVLLIRFTLDNFSLGQVNTVVGALSVAHVYLYTRNKKGLSAVAFVLAASIKLTPVILIAYHIAKLRLKFAALCLSLLAAVTAVSFLPFGSRGPETFKVFFNRTVRNEQGFGLAQAGNQSLRGTIARFMENNDSAGESEREPTSATTLVISIALIAIALFAARIASSDLAASAPLFCCFVILSPLSWKAHYVVLILPIAYLICRALESSGTRRAYSIAALIAVFVLFNLTSPKVIGLAAAIWADAHSLVLAGALLIFIATVGAGLVPARIAEGND